MALVGARFGSGRGVQSRLGADLLLAIIYWAVGLWSGLGAWGLWFGVGSSQFGARSGSLLCSGLGFGSGRGSVWVRFFSVWGLGLLYQGFCTVAGGI